MKEFALTSASLSVPTSPKISALVSFLGTARGMVVPINEHFHEFGDYLWEEPLLWASDEFAWEVQKWFFEVVQWHNRQRHGRRPPLFRNLTEVNRLGNLKVMQEVRQDGAAQRAALEEGVSPL